MYLHTDKPNRKGLNTQHFTDNSTGITMVRLYDTIILLAEEDYIRLNTDGFRTNHTKNCMNDFLPEGYRVFQKDFEWFVKTPTDTLEFTDNMKVVL